MQRCAEIMFDPLTYSSQTCGELRSKQGWGVSDYQVSIVFSISDKFYYKTEPKSVDGYVW